MHLTERSFGRFQRSFRLPYRPEPNDVQAQFDKGVLRILLPRPQQQQSGGRIQIRAGAGGGQGAAPHSAASASGQASKSAGAAADDPAMGGQGSGKVG